QRVLVGFKLLRLLGRELVGGQLGVVEDGDAARVRLRRRGRPLARDDASKARDDACAAARAEEGRVVPQVETEYDLARELLRLELLKLRVPVVRIAAADFDAAAAPRRQDVPVLLLNLNLRHGLVLRGQAVHLYRDEARDDDHQAEDEPLALEYDGEVLAKVRGLLRCGGGDGRGLREVAQRAVE